MINIYEMLAMVRMSWEHLETASHVLDDFETRLRDAERGDYLGVLYRTDYEVSGRGMFPVDMLRYTCSWPADEASARAISESTNNKPTYTVRLSKYHRDAVPELAESRWNSKFRWSVERQLETVWL
jgi:hypothetical protein